eukprot:TRINITY_DN1928_c0_g1_i2.p2 TRINITY_DN1928_c0_g1~~TRINITY_DN1928_c0_g1_i2.p2  ORF type:complete len:218 (-),score=109.11 TRINITY_DN1928_c0_g1_i2:110-763(-)
MKVVKGSGFKEIKAADLTAGFVGQTKDAVHKQVADVQGGVLFVDEAHELASQGAQKGPRDQFSGEAFNALMHAMGDEGSPAKCCMIFAGYPKEMERFMTDLNPGFKRRVTGGVFTLENAKPESLVAILKKQMAAYGRRLDSDNWLAVEQAFAKVPDTVLSKHNAGLVAQLMRALRDHVISQLTLDDMIDDPGLMDVYKVDSVCEQIAELSKKLDKQN